MIDLLHPDYHTARLIQVLVALLGIIIWVLYAYMFREKWRNAVGPITYFFNSLGLYLALIFGHLSVATYNFWSNIVRLHSAFLFIIIAADAVIHELKKRRQEKDATQ